MCTDAQTDALRVRDQGRAGVRERQSRGQKQRRERDTGKSKRQSKESERQRKRLNLMIRAEKRGYICLFVILSLTLSDE